MYQSTILADALATKSEILSMMETFGIQNKTHLLNHRNASTNICFHIKDERHKIQMKNLIKKYKGKVKELE